jgi:hypothetical protein
MVVAVDSRSSWKCVDVAPAIHFALEGDSSVRPRRTTRGSILTAEGRVETVEDGRLWLTDGHDVALCFQLPAAIDLSPMIGSRARVTLRDEPNATLHPGQLLSLTDGDGRVRMIACYGPAQAEHVLGDMHVRVALSQRSGGPVVFGTSQLQCIVHVGEHVEVSDASGAWVMHVVARTARGHVAYVIADRAFWRS